MILFLFRRITGIAMISLGFLIATNMWVTFPTDPLDGTLGYELRDTPMEERTQDLLLEMRGRSVATYNTVYCGIVMIVGAFIALAPKGFYSNIMDDFEKATLRMCMQS